MRADVMYVTNVAVPFVKVMSYKLGPKEEEITIQYTVQKFQQLISLLSKDYFYIYTLALSLPIYQSIILKSPAALALERTINTMKVPPVRLTVAIPIVGTMENGATLQLQHERMLQNTNGVPLQVMEQVELLAKLSVRTFKKSIVNGNKASNIVSDNFYIF